MAREYPILHIASPEGEIIGRTWKDPRTSKPMILIVPSCPSRIVKFSIPIRNGSNKKVEAVSQKELLLLIRVDTSSIDATDLWTLQDARGRNVQSMMVGSPQSSSESSNTMHFHLDTLRERACIICGTTANDGRIKRCACREAAYCSRECQLRHWEGNWEGVGSHKEECAWQLLCREFRHQFSWLPRRIVTALVTELFRIRWKTPRQQRRALSDWFAKASPEIH
jgi:hypothetical protein